MTAGTEAVTTVTPHRKDTKHAFPNACEAGSDLFETLTAVYPTYGCYLPTRQAMGLVLARFGERARPLMSAWHEIWAASVGDVEAYAKKIKLKPASPERPEEAVPDPNRPGPAFVRPVSFHILQEAVELVELMRAGTPFLMRLYGTGVVRNMCRKPGVRRLAEAAHVETVGEGDPVGPTSLGDLRVGFNVTDRATPYWSLPEFRERAGRGMAVAATPAALVDVVADMRRQGHRQAFLKGSASKSGTWVLDLDGEGDAAATEAGLKRLLGASWEKAWGGKGAKAFLVQGMTSFRAEHRFFVVGHRIVASTASDRALSVLDANPDRIVDARVAWLAEPAGTAGYYDRGACRAAVDRGLAARMAWGARDLARAMRGCGTGMDCYVIDMGLTHDGRVLPVEVNGITWAGLYAVPYARVARALARRAAAMVPHVVPVPQRIARQPAQAVGPAVARLVRTRDAGPPGVNQHLKSFVERRSGRQKEPRPLPRLGGMTVVPDLKAFREAPVPVSAPWRRRWLRHLAKSASREILSTAIDIMHRMNGGRLHLVRTVLHDGAVPEGIRSMPGWAHGWEWVPRRDFDNLAREPSVLPLIGISVGIDDIDLAAANDRDRVEDPVSLRQGGRARVEWVAGGTARDRAVLSAGGTFRVTAGAALLAPEPAALSETDLAALRTHAGAHASGKAGWGGYLKRNGMDVLEQVSWTGGDEAGWAALGLSLLAEAREHDAGRRVERALALAALVAERAVRGMGRIPVVRVPGLPDGAYGLATGGPGEGIACLTVAAWEVDLPGTAALCVAAREQGGAEVVVVRDGAVAKPIAGPAEVADAA